MPRLAHRKLALIVLAALLCMSAFPALAGAAAPPAKSAPKITAAPAAPGSNAFGAIPPASQLPTTSTTATNGNDLGGSLSFPIVVLIVLGGIALIGGIDWLIMRDARANAPKRKGERSGPRKTQTPRADRVQRSRARAKAARQARKRTR